MPEMSVADEAELYLKIVADPASEPGRGPKASHALIPIS